MRFPYLLAAEAVVVLHFTWIVFVATGAFVLRDRQRLRLFHLAAVLYSLAIEIYGWVCPLTYLEQWLWRRAGRDSYQGAFIAHYLEKIIYLQVPQWLLIALVALLLAVTLWLYFRPSPPIRKPV